MSIQGAIYNCPDKLWKRMHLVGQLLLMKEGIVTESSGRFSPLRLRYIATWRSVTQTSCLRRLSENLAHQPTVQ